MTTARAGAARTRPEGADDLEPDRGPSAPTRRVVQILELLAELPEERRSLSEIARELQLNKATCHAILTTLVACGYLTRDPETKSFRLGPALVRIGTAAEAASPIAASASSELAALHERLGFPTSAVGRDAEELVVLDCFPRNHSANNAVAVIGQRIPLIAPIGELFMAWAEQDDVEAWIAAGEDTGDEKREHRLREVLREVRARRYTVQRVSDRAVQSGRAITRLAEQMPTERSRLLARQLINELDQRDYLESELAAKRTHAVSVISAPVQDRHGDVVLSISVWPRDELTKAEVDAIARSVVEAADRVSALL